MAPTAPKPPRRRFVHSVATRIAFGTTVVVWLVTGGLLYALLRYEQGEQLQAKRDAAAMVVSLFAEVSSAPVLFTDDAGIAESLGFLRSNAEVEEAALFSAHDPSDSTAGLPLGRLVRDPSQPARLRAPHASDVGTSRESTDRLDVSGWVSDPSGQHIAIAMVRFSLAHERANFELIEQRLLQASLGLAGVLTLLLLVLARSFIIRPLQAVHAAVREVSAGSRRSAAVQKRLPLHALDEVGDLARGFVTMADAIERREAAIATQNSEMRLVLESVGEGFLVLDAQGLIEGQHSAILEGWFGDVPHGRTLWQYLRPHDPEQAEWLEMTWANLGAPSMPLALILEQLPSAFIAGARHYKVDYRPLCGPDDQLTKMVVVISDVTALRQREQAESEQRELVAVFGALIRDRPGFISMCEDAKLLIKYINEPPKGEPYDLLEHLHTIKGNAFLFRLRTFGDACEQLEAQCEREKRAPQPDDAARLLHAFTSSVQPVELFIALDRGHHLQMSSHDYGAIVHALQSGEPAKAVLMRLLRATAEPADVVFGRFSERLQVLVRRLGKCPTRVLCDGHGVRFPKQTFAPLWAVMVHVLRNIADHGLETAWEREQAHKREQASVFITAVIEHDTLVICFRDDGRGVDWEKVRERARKMGLPHETRAELTAALLGHGFSTLDANTALSGRGVGLAAVHTEVIALAGTVRIESEAGQGTELTIALPASLVIA